jgi:elongation factor G
VRDLQGDEIAKAKEAYDELWMQFAVHDDELGMMFLEEKPITSGVNSRPVFAAP